MRACVHASALLIVRASVCLFAEVWFGCVLAFRLLAGAYEASRCKTYLDCVCILFVSGVPFAR